MDKITETVVTIGMAVIGVAILSVLVSQKANTVGVIQAAASGFGNILGVATAPVTGSNVQPDLSYPSSAGGFGGLSLPSINIPSFH